MKTAYRVEENFKKYTRGVRIRFCSLTNRFYCNIRLSFLCVRRVKKDVYYTLIIKIPTEAL